MSLTPEGDIAEVFEQVSQIVDTGLVVRAAHNRALSEPDSYLWEEVSSQPVQFIMEIKLPKTKKRPERQATKRGTLCSLEATFSTETQKTRVF